MITASRAIRWVNMGCGLYTLVIAASLLKWWKGVDIPPDPIHPPGPLEMLVSPYALMAIGVVLVVANVYGALQNRASPA